jgi:hypothetical protein
MEHQPGLLVIFPSVKPKGDGQARRKGGDHRMLGSIADGILSQRNQVVKQ